MRGGLDYPHFLLNYKLYEGTAGEAGLALARTVEAVAERTGATFALAPQTPDLARIAATTSLPVVAQSVDAFEPGRGTGRVSLPSVAAAGADGLLVNHPERRARLVDVERAITGCREHGLESIVCVDGLEVGRAVLAFDPDCLLFERPADIRTGMSVVRTSPERVERFVAMVEAENPRTRVLLGGGISTASDVERALGLGADAAGAASAFLEATDRRRWLSDIAAALSATGD
jgi:triosephosphate isomerase